MAENQETYKTTIEVETEGAENVELLNRTIKTSIGEFENLNEAIGKTQDTLGKLDPKKDAAKFKELSKELQVLKDNLKDTEIQSVRFTEALAAQPGVIGFVGQSLEGLRGTFKVFMANPIIAVLAGIAGAFLALRESLTRTEEGTAKLSKISDGFTKILNGLFAIIEPIAMALADLVIGLLENDKVMNGLSKTVGVVTGVFTTLFGTLKSVAGFIIDTLVNNFKTLIGVAKGAGDVIAGVFTFDWDRIKEGANAAFDAVKEGVSNTVDNVKDLGNGIVDAAVDGFKAGEEQFKKGFKRLTETEKAANEKAEEERKKRAEERKKLLEEAQRVETEAYLALLDERTRELTIRETKFIEDKKKLIAAGITDFTNLEEAYRNDVQAINDKYDEQAIAKQQEQIAKQKELLDSVTDYRTIEVEIAFQQNEEAFNKEIATINDRERMLVEGAKMASDELLANKQLTDEERIRIVNETNQRISDIEAQASADRLSAQEERYQNRLALITTEEQNLLNNINETERLLLENTQLTEDEITAIKLQAEQQRAQIALEFQQQRKEVKQVEKEDELLSLEIELSDLSTGYDRRIAIVNEKEQLLLEQEGLTEAQRTAIVRGAAEERDAIRMSEMEAQADIQNAQLDLLAEFGSFMKTIAGKNKKLAIAGVIAEQAAAIGKIVVNTSIANAKAVATSPLTFGMPWVAINTISAGLGIASSIAAGIKAVRDINNSDKGTGAVSGGGGASSLPRPAAPSVSGASAISTGGTSSSTPTDTGNQIGQTIGGVQNTTIPQTIGTNSTSTGNQNLNETIVASQKQSSDTVAGTMDKSKQIPIRAYVVSGEISAAQALDRRTTQAATFG